LHICRRVLEGTKNPLENAKADSSKRENTTVTKWVRKTGPRCGYAGSFWRKMKNLARRSVSFVKSFGAKCNTRKHTLTCNVLSLSRGLPKSFQCLQILTIFYCNADDCNGTSHARSQVNRSECSEFVRDANRVCCRQFLPRTATPGVEYNSNSHIARYRLGGYCKIKPGPNSTAHIWLLRHFVVSTSFPLVTRH